VIQSGVVQAEELAIDRGVSALEQVGERDARSSLRAQVARLERELSAIVADGFPHISPTAGTARGPAIPGLGVGSFQGTRLAAGSRASGPRLLSLEQLERLRDELAGRVQELRRRAHERAEHERAARELLERMRLEPGRYKFVRLPVRDLGQGGCGVWEVRPRLGLIGMLAGWWQLKLSSGCPLPMGSRPRRGPGPPS
jgi:hypothetical protein